MNNGRGEYNEGLGYFRMRYRLVGFPLFPIPRMADQSKLVFVTVYEAQRYFVTSVEVK
jgi:hypothetical protein